MTDNEIIKALEYCIENECDMCPLPSCDSCVDLLLHNALIHINRQKAEIERLNGYINTNCLDCAGCKQWKCDCSNVQAEAIKEFAEKMKGVLPEIDDTYIERIVEDYIDNLVKEMVGEDK